jgi:hypothetical protein
MGRIVGRVLCRVTDSRKALDRCDSSQSLAILLVLLLLVSLFIPPLSDASDGGTQLPGTSAHHEFSADDFDWREMVPYLFAASALPGEQGIKAVLENCKVLRVYVANEIRARCGPDKKLCPATNDSSVLEKEVSKRIDEIVQEGISRRHHKAIMDYTLSRRPFPFSEIAAVKSENHSEAYFMLTFANRSYTAADVQAKYGAPYDTDVVQWYSVFKYRLDSPHYASKAVFEIDPIDGAVLKVSISLKTKKPKKEKSTD